MEKGLSDKECEQQFAHIQDKDTRKHSMCLQANHTNKALFGEQQGGYVANLTVKKYYQQ